jgi:transketolase
LTARSLEQIKNDVAYSNNPVKLVGISAGVSYGALGSTHHSLHDLAVLQAINNIDIVVPADNFETREAIMAAVNHPRPIYLRFGKRPMYDLHAPGTAFRIGKAIILQQGTDVNLLATGETVAPAWMACQLLEQQGISAGVVSLHTIKPLDVEAVLATAKGAPYLITVEEHSIYGGLGSSVAALLMQAGVFPRLKIVGFPDEYTATGSQTELFKHYGISAEGLAATAVQMMEETVRAAS